MQKCLTCWRNESKYVINRGCFSKTCIMIFHINFVTDSHKMLALNSISLLWHNIVSSRAEISLRVCQRWGQGNCAGVICSEDDVIPNKVVISYEFNYWVIHAFYNQWVWKDYFKSLWGTSYMMCKHYGKHHNGYDEVSNHQRLDCLLNCLFRPKSKKIWNSLSLAFVRGIHQWPVNSPHKESITWKMFPFDYVISKKWWCQVSKSHHT